MLEDILEDSDEFSDSNDLRIGNEFCYINVIKLNSYDYKYLKNIYKLN